MSAWAKPQSQEGRLYGRDGRLLTVRVKVEANLLEELLEALAELPYPINPQIFHERHWSTVEFPCYEGWLSAVRTGLTRAQLSANVVEVADFVLEDTQP
jgi:hypothetical protein